MHQILEDVLQQIESKDKKYIAPMKEIMKYISVQEHEEQLKEYEIQQTRLDQIKVIPI